MKIMKKRMKFLVAGLATAVMTSCSMTLPVAVSDLPIGSKEGVSKTIVLFGAIHLNGDYSVAEAAQKGGIKGGISTVDEKTSHYLIFVKKELIVTGE